MNADAELITGQRNFKRWVMTESAKKSLGEIVLSAFIRVHLRFS